MIASADLVLRMAGVVMLAFIAIVWWRDLRGHLAGPLVALFSFGVASYLLCPLLHRSWQFGLIELPFFFGCFGGAVFFWLMSRALFDDGFRLRIWHAGLLVFAEALHGVRWLINRSESTIGIELGFDLSSILLTAHQLLSLALTVAALVQAHLGRADDLVEARLRLRDRFVWISGIYILVIVATEIYFRDQSAAPALELINVGTLFFVVFAFAVAMTRLRPAILPVVSEPGPAISQAQPRESDEPLLTALRNQIEVSDGYRQANLTIGGLADQLGTQEYRLRRVINASLGFRNFNEFLNAYRIAEAQRRLTDPACARLPILTIAMDCGFASIGPFNRAFKEATGMTPSEVRRLNLNDQQTKSEKI